ncbi:anti-phage deoxyguanosine triphosphatase [Paraglaciecola aquimarina]|uniref:Deoxyguanosinetriphosphate triphosphohydrolase-like protein n=1 Tax=Paraglaciecola aquimarina TaxID=1235557 RepID=A0ABU3SZ52_9ALTE|nr:anti-phage deoxyguanosine triphosphatase [Paraglaciecola aquimarina]MDU0355291.1 anti-phage deoxyguanosine triphosphatase [Paraglaciecola aquimarina]
MEPWTNRFLDKKTEREGDHRTPFQRDKARILHSAAFRRLQSKTQVLGVGMSDFYRTRLTHSLEASQIGQGIAAQLRTKYPALTKKLGLNDILIEALCLAHDIGHPPFGHGGEVALHYMMRDHGGFEGNGQTFRIVTRLEPYTADAGMNLSRRTLLGLVKYPNFIDNLHNPSVISEQQSLVNKRQIKAKQWHPPKGLYHCDKDIFDWLLAPLSEADKKHFSAINTSTTHHSKTKFKSFDCSIMELADDIAYSVHDLEDAIVMGIANQQQFEHEVVKPIKQLGEGWLSDHIEQLSEKLFSNEHHLRKDAIGALVNCFITNIEINETDATFSDELLVYNATFPKLYQRCISVFKQYVFKRVILKPELQLLEYKGQQIVMELFEAFNSDPLRLLPDNTKTRWLEEEANNNGHRVISDYIAGMTDGFASKLYSTLFLPTGNGLPDPLN